MLRDDVMRKLRDLGKAQADDCRGAEADEPPKAASGPADGGARPTRDLDRLRRRVLSAGPSSADSPKGASGPPPRGCRLTLPVDVSGPLEGDEVTTDIGPCLALRSILGDIAEWGEEFWASLTRFLAAHSELLQGKTQDQIAFIDIETTGLSAQPLFLIGLLQADERGPSVTQFLARDYTEEAAAILAAQRHVGSGRTLLSYNGQTFDLPYIKDRARYHRLRVDLPKLPHVDLLIHARRKWRGRLADCKLQTLERELLGIGRTSDIPGALIPEAYHEFVRSGRPRQMHEILHHNRLDLLTLAALTPELLD